MKSPKEIAETQFGRVQWLDAENGICACPGESRHTHTTHPKDCHIFLAGVPTVYCFHTSCREAVESANRRFRSAVAGGSCANTVRMLPSPQDAARQREKAFIERLKRRAEHSRSQILAEYSTDPADMFEQSPCRLWDEPENDWRLLLALFAPDDTVWIGDVADSGPGHEWNFRPVSEWLALPRPPGPFTCPSIFQPGVCSRSKENIARTPFLVVESDVLTKPEICAVFSWLRQFLNLRAIVDTAGKSLHGWFDYPPSPAVEAELKIILPPLGCDPAMFKPSQPCRLPGVKRGEGIQALLFLDMGPAQQIPPPGQIAEFTAVNNPHFFHLNTNNAQLIHE
jgi:hypothetical protein